MLICIMVLAATAAGGWYLRKREYDIPDKIIKIMLCLQCLGIVLCVYDGITGNHTGAVTYNDVGEGTSSEQWLVSGDGFTEELEVEIPEKKLTREQAEALFEAAQKEIDETFLGENEDWDRVTKNVAAQAVYQEGQVEAVWNFDNSDIVTSDGTLQPDHLEQETLVQAEVTLYCQEYESQYCFSFQVCPPAGDTAEGFLYHVRKALRSAGEAQGTEEKFIFPEETGEGVKLKWSKEENRGAQIALLGTAAGLALVWGEKEERRRKAKQAEEEKLRDYPDIVSSLSLFLGAGLSVQAAMGRIGEQYLLRKRDAGGRKREGFEQILMTYREMRDGTGEMEALRHLGERNSLREYRKLSLLLQQNLRKGTKELLDILEREEALSFELRQNLAKRAGEEASTRLLLPMMGFLVVVMAVLLMPAMMSIQI